MKRATYDIKRSQDGQFYFVLVAPNGEPIATGSETYTTKAMCKKGIRSVRLNAPIAKLVDKT